MGQTGRSASRQVAVVAGATMVVVALLTLVASVCQLMPTANVDFPCESGLSPRPVVTTTTRLAWCISYYPRYAISGGAVYAYGSSDEDQATITPMAGVAHYGAISLQRQGDALLVNGQGLRSGESYHSTNAVSAASLWHIMLVDLQVTNEGRMQYAYGLDSNAIQAVYLSGGLSERWTVSPAGLVILIGGIILLVLGRRSPRPLGPGPEHPSRQQ